MSVERAAEAIGRARSLLVTAGAGMGVDSGLPDFRGPEGFWKAYPMFRQAGLRFEQLANPRWFRTDPALAWGFYGHRLNLYRATRPHEGFAILARWAEGKPSGAAVFTSNVDGHFQAAGFPETRVTECHGSIHWLQCADGCGTPPWPAHGVTVTVDPATCRAEAPLPACRACGRVARPNILMFGDWGWDGQRTEEQEERLDAFLATARTPLVVVELGAGQAVPTVRLFSERTAAARGATLVRINSRDPQVPRKADVSISAGAAATLLEVDALLAAR